MTGNSSAAWLAAFAVLLALLSLALPALGCQCLFGKPKQKFCHADWVSRATITAIERANLTDLPDGLLPAPHFAYTVKYAHVYKAPEELNGTLPALVYTPDTDALCGIFLEKGSEYLLSGRFINGTAVTTLCAQILFDDKTASMQNDVLLWKEVPANLTQRLDTADKSFRPCN